jgi:hypothetical protein
VVSHRWLLQARKPGFKASHLSCAARAIVHGKGIVKVHGVFPSSCGQPASSPALQVRRVSRQDSRTFVTPFVQVGISLRLSHSVSREAGLYLSHPVFIVEAISRIFSMPPFVKCSPIVIHRRILLNFTKSILFFDFSGCCSKKGTIRSFR